MAIKPLSVAWAIAHMKEWLNYTAVMKTGEDDDYFYFTAKNFQLERVEVRIERNVSGSADYNVYTRPVGSKETWEWADAIALLHQ